jgi:hypothetical protein
LAATSAAGEHVTDESIVTSCSKMQVLDRMLRHLKANGHKVLIFSQFARTLEILCDYMELRESQFGGYEHLDGSTPREERQSAMDRFNTDPDTFAYLLSTRAGGLGINLTGADTVIIYDSDWNPHADSQAEDRAHRIGQTRPVVVYRLVTAGSVEEGLVHRANSKRALERVVLQEGKWLREREDEEAAVSTPATAPTRGSSRLSKRQRTKPSAPPASQEQEEEGVEEEGQVPRVRGRGARSVKAAGSAAGTTPSGKRSRGAAGADKHTIERKDMRRWLREDLESAGIGRPIGASELEGILDRSAVLAAGAQVLTRVEGDEAAAKLGFTPDQLRVAAAEAARTSSAAKTPSSSSSSSLTHRLPTRGPGYEVTYHSVSALKSIAQFAVSDADGAPTPT